MLPIILLAPRMRDRTSNMPSMIEREGGRPATSALCVLEPVVERIPECVGVLSKVTLELSLRCFVGRTEKMAQAAVVVAGAELLVARHVFGRQAQKRKESDA